MTGELTHNPGGSTLEIASTLLERGLVPLPTARNSKRPILCGRPTAPEPTADALRSWFGRGAHQHNLGIRTGKISGILVLDVDPRHTGDQSLDQLVQKHGPLPETVLSLTPSGGQHYYFQIPKGVKIGNSNGTLGPGLDIRSEGGQVLCFPSTIDGREYQFAGGALPRREDIAPCPQWLLALLQSPAPPKSRGNGAAGGVLVEGKRNDGLFRLASSLRGKGLGGESILAALRVENKRICASTAAGF